MANQQKTPEENIELFKTWSASLGDSNFKEMTHNGS